MTLDWVLYVLLFVICTWVLTNWRAVYEVITESIRSSPIVAGFLLVILLGWVGFLILIVVLLTRR